MNNDEFELGIGCGFMIGLFIMGIILRVAFSLDPEFYGDRCLNDNDYRIDTVYTYNNGKLVNTEYKFVKKK